MSIFIYAKILSLFFQPAELAAMMPHWLNLNLNRTLDGIASCIHLLDELVHLFWRQSPGFDSPYLATVNAVMPSSAIDSHNRIFRRILAIAVAEVEQFFVKKAVTKRPGMVYHCLHQFVLASKLLEGKYPSVWIHLLHLNFILGHDANEFDSGYIKALIRPGTQPPTCSLDVIGLFKSNYYIIIAMIIPENLESTIIKTFRNSGYRATPQRIAINRYLLRNHEHPTAQKAYLEVKKMHQTVSLATIYTTI